MKYAPKMTKTILKEFYHLLTGNMKLFNTALTTYIHWQLVKSVKDILLFNISLILKNILLESS